MSRKALIHLSYPDLCDDHRAIETMRILAQAQEFSSTDVSEFLTLCTSNRLGIAEYMLSLASVREDLIYADEGINLYPALGPALRHYGAHVTSDLVKWEYPGQALTAKWESIIRKLLHIGVDIHAPVPRGNFFHSSQSESYPCTLSTHGTPLDELFTYTNTAGEAQDAADAWLQILSTEGVDVLAYLEKEVALHATEPIFTCSHYSCDYLPRQLVFNLGEAPNVYADWWIDPECSTYHVRQELKDTNILASNDYFIWGGWTEYDNSTWKRVWPIRYPRWSDFLKPSVYDSEDLTTWERLSERAQERADRRWQKKARKAAQRNGTQVHSSMPGAWPKG